MSAQNPQPKASLKTDIIAGITTFFTMAYIVVVNPAILSTEGTGISFAGAMTATVMLCFTMTLLMGWYAKLPYAVAPGMGINAFFTYTIILGDKVPWQTAMGIVVWAGVIFLIISVTPLREKLALAIPENLRLASAAGIGLFLTFIGLRNVGLVVGDSATLVTLGKIGGEQLLALGGTTLCLVMLQKKSPYAFLTAIAAVTLTALALGWVAPPKQILQMPDFDDVFLKFDLWGALSLALIPAIFGIVFTDFFDSISTFVGLAHAGDLIDPDGKPKNLREGLIVDSLATLFAGVFGTSSGTAYIESASGIEAGGRRGISAIVTACCFLPCFFLAPLAGLVPSYATGPVLIIVGFLMFRSISKIAFDAIEEAIPAFLAIILVPLTFSITQGIMWGLISYVGLHLLAGKHRKIRPTLYFIALACVLFLYLEQR